MFPLRDVFWILNHPYIAWHQGGRGEQAVCPTDWRLGIWSSSSWCVRLVETQKINMVPPGHPCRFPFPFSFFFPFHSSFFLSFFCRSPCSPCFFFVRIVLSSCRFPFVSCIAFFAFSFRFPAFLGGRFCYSVILPRRYTPPALLASLKYAYSPWNMYRIIRCTSIILYRTRYHIFLLGNSLSYFFLRSFLSVFGFFFSPMYLGCWRAHVVGCGCRVQYHPMALHYLSTPFTAVRMYLLVVFLCRSFETNSCIASGWWYAWYLRSAQETAVSSRVPYEVPFSSRCTTKSIVKKSPTGSLPPAVPLAITRTFRPWTHTSDDSYIYQLSLVATATVSFLGGRFFFLFLFFGALVPGTLAPDLPTWIL